MTNFIFKSANRLTKNSPITTGALYLQKFNAIQAELRHQRQDNLDIKRMLNRLLIEKHLQMEVDDFYEKQDGNSSSL